MGQGPAVTAVCCACTVATFIGPAAAGHCSQGPVGTCTADNTCLPTYGPTQCINNQCMCNRGYCNARMDSDDSVFNCRANVGECSLLNPCESGHGGPHAVECVDGLCLCHSGFHADEDGICQRGWWPPPFLTTVANSSGRPAPIRTAATRTRVVARLPLFLGVVALLAAAGLMAAWSRGTLSRAWAEALCKADTGTPYKRLLAVDAPGAAG
mmetsp:Transcript_87748/g.204199  ORF Transcript_87748/g.204199 Transcript_87748/m.204199 type:complete len:211 (+) Transcript_87748:94-726(+)